MKKTLLALAAVTFSTFSFADIIGAEAGIGMWMFGMSGDMNTKGEGKIDVDSTLGVDDDSGIQLFALVEHPVPLIPNLKIQQSSVKLEGKKTISETISFADQSFEATDPISTTLDFSHTDATLYYEILDNWVNLDLGLTIRMFDGEVALDSAAKNGSADLSFPLPMGYVKAQFDLPLSGFYASGTMNVISISGTGVTDLALEAGYKIGLFGVAVGYRSINFSISDDLSDDLNADLTVDGLYAGVQVDI